MPSSSAAVYRSSVAMCACTRKASSPASTARSTSARTRSRLASASPGRAGTRLAPLRNRRSPLIENTQSVNATSRSPVRRDVIVADLAVDDDLDSHLGQRLPAERVRPPQPRARRCRATTRCRCCRRPGCARSRRRPAPSADVRMRTVSVGESVEAGVQAQVGAGLVGVATQHTKSIDAHGAGVVDAHGAPQATGVPVVVDGLGVLQHAGDVAPSRCSALGRAGHLDRQHVLVRHRRQLGDVEGVGEEVALGDRRGRRRRARRRPDRRSRRTSPTGASPAAVGPARSGDGRAPGRRWRRTRDATASARGRRVRATRSRRGRGRCRCGAARRRPPGHARGQRDPRRLRLGALALGSEHE